MFGISFSFTPSIGIGSFESVRDEPPHSDKSSFIVFNSSIKKCEAIFSAAINSRDTFEYFLEYSVEKTKLVLSRNNNIWSLCYKVYPSYLYDQNKFKDNTNISHVDRIVVHLNDFFKKNVKKYYH